MSGPAAAWTAWTLGALHTPPAEGTPRTVADDTTASSRSSGGSMLLAALVIAAAVASIPGTMFGVLCAVIGVEYRRVRTSRWLLWAAITLVVAVIAAGVDTGQWMAWSTSFAATTWASGLVAGFDTGIFGWAAANTDLSPVAVIATQLGFGLPTGFAVGAVFSAFRSRARRLEGVVEGDSYSNMRPVGWLDELNEKRVRARISDGAYLQEGRD